MKGRGELREVLRKLSKVWGKMSDWGFEVRGRVSRVTRRRMTGDGSKDIKDKLELFIYHILPLRFLQ